MADGSLFIGHVLPPSTVLKAKKIWITSNLHPNDWYPELDQETKSALIRRLTIVHFVNPLI